MTLDQIAYTAEPDNCREVAAWLKARNLYAECTLCGGTGEYEGEHGPKGCAACCSRLIAVKDRGVVRYADWGDTIAWDGFTVKVIRPEAEHEQC